MTTETWFDGQPHPIPVFLREEIHPGDELDGPAIICEPTSTVVIDLGFRATVLSRGEILIAEVSSARPNAVSTETDPVQLEIFNNLFASIAEQMGVTLQRTAVSTNVKERLDFSCAVFSARGELVVNAPHIPVHLGAMSETVKHVLAENRDLAPGDVFVTNDPYRGGSHLPDVTVVTPVHHPATGRLLFVTASRAHHAEIGGTVPGSMPPFSHSLGEEGVLISNFKLVEGKRSHEEDLRRLLLSGPYPTRNVGDNLADIAAQVAANALGVRQLRELVDRYSLAVVTAYMDHIQRAASQKMRLALARFPDGTYSRTDHLDDGSPIAVSIVKRGERAVVDFTRNGAGPLDQPERESGHRHGRRALRVSLFDRRGDPAQQRSARTGGHHFAHLPAQPAGRRRPEPISRRRGGQRGDVAARRRRAARARSAWRRPARGR